MSWLTVLSVAAFDRECCSMAKKYRITARNGPYRQTTLRWSSALMTELPFSSQSR
jgi:hypothetical protein